MLLYLVTDVLDFDISSFEIIYQAKTVTQEMYKNDNELKLYSLVYLILYPYTSKIYLFMYVCKLYLGI